jgi:hypothetical protein
MYPILIFLAAIVGANLSVAYFGPASTPINAFLLIGLDLSLRDKIHEQWHGKHLYLKMFWLILSGAVITWLFNRDAGILCVASVVAFSVALFVDAAMYELFFKQTRLVKMNISNVGSAAADSIIFPSIAFGVFMPEIVVLQFIAKVCGGALWSLILSRSNHTINSDRAKQPARPVI